ncbi:MAG: OmpH family outer membrane protein [Dysgonamonadaceae bacterium]|jgi:outer membrane protein|nr:OmpH family outer membrane protein [Dysgonamonadaceae bacterium]
MLKKLLILFIAIAPIAAVAQNVKLAYIDTQEIIMAMPELSGIEGQIATRQEQMQATMQALQTEYTNKMTDFEALPETTSEAIRQDRVREIVQIQERLQTFVQNSEQELAQLWQTLFEPVQRRVSDAIKAVADEGAYTFVFDMAPMQSQPIVYVSDSASNITQAVKTRLGIR